MTTKTRRFLSLVLCAVMLLSLLPGITASATEFQSETITTDEYGNYHIASFEDLKELSAGTYDAWTNVYLNSDSELVISENLTIPENLSLQLYDNPLTIPAGVTLTSLGHINGIIVNVAGTWNCEGGFRISDKLNITGSLNQNNYGSINSDTEVIGKDKITFDKYSTIETSYTLTGASTAVADIQELISLAEDTPNEHWRYSVDIETEDALVLNQDLILPINMVLNIYAGDTVTIGKGVTLSLSEYTFITSPLVIEGTLINNGGINLYNEGALTLAESGSYEGSAELSIDKKEGMENPGDVLSGFDLDDFELTEEEYYWNLRNVAGLTKLPAPTDLTWGSLMRWRYDEATGTSSREKITLPGAITWNGAAGSTYRIYVYMEGQTSPILEDYVWSEEAGAVSSTTLCAGDLESGTYYFTVTAIGDYETTCNSTTVTSDTWTYTKPSASLSAPTNISWNWPYATFTLPADTAKVGGYAIQFLFAETKDAEPRLYIWSEEYYADAATTSSYHIWMDMVNDLGKGYYYFRIRALSSDITSTCNSAWSELSPAYYCEEGYINPFTDVDMNEYYGDAVLWALNWGITTGTTATTFEPNTNCTRGQIVTFLWRAAGYPMPTSKANPFTDVTESDYFYNAVLWAVENGITNGLSATTFGPNESCTRGQVATFLWRAEGKPAHSGNNIFTDLEAGAYYYDAVLWAVENDITKGMGNGLFAPHTTCTRGQIVTFLYRAIA